ncbi:A-kinase anchor protein 12 [Pseudorasbora parva]|uniref:A-kinase anchor protein 12 n=1 Tax=Pseudorasbora parva TaxID=51549 RepID=UPI00351EDB87
MGATASSPQRDSRCEEDEVAEELTAAASDAQDHGSADDKLLQKNGQISILNVKTKNHADELNDNFEERVLSDVGSGFVTLKEDGTETTEDLQEMDVLQPNIKNESTEMINVDAEEPEEDKQVNEINEVGFKKIFRFVGFKFTLKKDCEKTEENEQEERVASPSEDSSDTQESSAVAANENTPDETHKSEASSQPDAAEPSQQTDNETELDPDIKLVEHQVEDTPDKDMAKESPEPEEQMSPFKQFFTQGIFASLRKKKKEEEMQKESKEEELKRIEKMGADEAEHEDSKCMCLDIPYIISEEEKDSVEKADDKLLPEGELQNFLEKDKVEGSPLKRLFRKFSTRRQRESKAAEKVIEVEEQVSEQPKPSLEFSEQGKREEPVIGEPKPKEELVADVSPQESKKKSDTTVSWEALICGGSSKKKARKTNEEETADKGEENEKTTDSPLGSSFEGDYDHLTSSNEQTGSPAEGEMGSTWKTFKKMVTPKRKVRTGESSTPEQIPSDSEMSKDDSFSMKKLIPGHKKRKSEARKEQTSSDEASKDHETGDEDDETPAIIPLSEYEIIEPESLKEVNEQRVEITIEHEMPEMLEEMSQVLEQDTSNDLVPKIAAKVSSNSGPTIIHGLPEDFEELTDFVSKHQQLSDIPEEGIIEESIETPVSSAEWTTQDDTLAEDIVELTADAVTAPEPSSEQFNGDDTTEMVSAVSQLTESPRTSGHVTPVTAEYSVQTSDVILQEAIQSICLTPSVQSVTTKDERQESLAVSCSPYIVQSSTPEETKVLVAHNKTEATAICTGLVSQEIESVEEHLPAHLLEAIPEVSDAIPTELVPDNFTDEPEAAELGTDEVYEAEIKDVKTEYQEVHDNDKEFATKTQLEVEHIIKLVKEPLVEESEETHMEDKTEECATGIELRQLTDTMQSEAGLVQVMSDSSHGSETECPLYPELEAPVYEQLLAAEPEKKLKLPDVELSSAEFEQAALTEVVETSTLSIVDNIPDTTTSKASDVLEEEIERISSAEECLESKETISIISPSSDHIVAETLELEDNLEIEEVESIHVDVCEIQVDIEDAFLLPGDSAVTVEDISEKMEETNDGKIARQEIKEKHVEEESEDVVASEVVQNIEAKNILEAVDVDESLAREQLLDKEVSLAESILDKEAEEIHKDIYTDVDNKVEESASDRMDRIFVKEEEELVVKEGQPLANTESNETENQDIFAHTNTTDESPETTVDADTENGEMVHEIREHTVVSDFSKDMFEHTETPAETETSCEVILTPLETALSEVKATPVQTEIVASQTEEWGEDTKHSPEPPKANEQPVTTENIKTGKVLEMVAIIENTTKQSVKEKLIVVEPEQEGEASKMTIVHAEAIYGDQASAMASTLMKVTAVPEEKDAMVVAPKLEPERFDSEQTIINVAQNDTQMEVSNLSELKNEADEDTRLKCEPLEQLIETKLSNELLVDKAEIKDEMPAVTEVTPIAQVLPLSSEFTVEMADISVSEIQTQVVSELRAATLEVTEPKVEMPVLTEVNVETAVVTELEVETPVVTSVVKELEVETPVVISMAKTTDTHNSVVTPQNQDIDTDRSVLTTVIKEHMEGMPTVISVVVTPATPLDEVTPFVTLVNESIVVAQVDDTPVVTVAAETPNLESVIVRTAMAPVVEIQNVIPVVATPDPGSVLVTEAASSVLSTETVTTVAEAAVLSTVVETPIVSFTAVKSTPALVAEMPAVIEKTNLSPVVEIPVVQTPTGPNTMSSAVTSVVESPAVSSVTETVPSEEVTLDVTPSAETPVSQAIESPVVYITSVKQTVAAVTQTAVIEIPATIPETVTESVSSVVATTAINPVVSEKNVTLVVESPAVSSIAVAETSSLITVAETPTQISVIVAEETPPVTPAATLAVDTSAVIPVVETPVVKSTPLAVVETPVVTPEVQTPGQVSLVVTETASAVVCSVVTAAIETPIVIPVVETTVLKSAPLAVVEAPVLTPPVQIPHQVLMSVTEAAPPVVVSSMTSAAETPVVITVAETPVVKLTPVAVAEMPVVAPVTMTSTVTPIAERSVLSLVQETTVGAPTAITVTEIPDMIPAVQTPALVSEIVKEAAPPLVLPAVTAAAETPVVKPTPVAVAEMPVVTPVTMTSTVTPIAERSVVSLVQETTVDALTGNTVTESPEMIPAVQTPALVSEIVKEAAPPVVLPAVTSAAETPVVKPTLVPVAETPVVTPVTMTSTVTPIAERSVLSLVQETTVGAPTAITVAEIPDMIPAVQTPALVSEIVKEAASPLVLPAVTSAAETPVVKPTPVAVAEMPAVTSVTMTSTVTPIADRSVVSLVQETTVGAATGITVAEKPVVIPVVQTPALVSVILKEATPPVVLPAVTAATETSVVSPIVETLTVKTTVSVVETPVPVVPVEAPAVTTLPLKKATPVGTVIETPPVTIVAPQETSAAQIPVLAPVMVTPAIGQVVVEPAEPVTSTEPQSEVEDDVWEDAVDNIGDSQGLVTIKDGPPQDAAAKQASDAAI